MIENLRTQLVLSIFFVALNLLLLNVNLREVSSLRVDMTEGDIYSLSDVTRRLVSDLDEDLVIKAYFSKPDAIEEQIRPLVPEVKDLLLEYAAVSEGRVKVEFVTPEEDKEAEDEASSEYGVQAIPYLYEDARQQGVKSFYFAIVIKYAAAKPVTISILDIMKYGSESTNREIRVELRNVEFFVTRAIKKARFGFESQRDIFEKFAHQMDIVTYISPEDTLPEIFKKIPAQADKVLSELAKNSGGKFTYKKGELPPDENGEMALERQTGVYPISLPMSEKRFYLWAAGHIDGQQIQPFALITSEGALGEHELRERFEGLIRRLSPGILKTIGIAQDSPEMNPMAMQMGQRPPPPPFAALAQELGEEFDVKDLDLKTLTDVPGGIDVLLVMEPKEITPKAAYAIDQFVMRGGRAVFCIDRVAYENPWPPGTLSVQPQKTGLEDVLGNWGIQIFEDVVLDAQCGQWIWPARSGGMGGRESSFGSFNWPAMPLVLPDDEAVNTEGAPFLDSIEGLRFWLPSPIDVNAVDGLRNTWLVRSSAESWRASPSTLATPNLRSYPDNGMPLETKNARRQTLAVSLTGKFKSWFADKPVPGSESEGAASRPAGDATRSPTIRESRETRVIVVANGDWLSNDQYQTSQYRLGNFRQNFNALKSMIDWMLEDDELLTIKGRGRSYRPLARLDDAAINRTYIWNFATPFAVVIGLGIAVWSLRSQRRPII